MPYRLKVTVEEMREELAKLGFTEVATETIKDLQKDLLKLIKNDLRKIKQENQQPRISDQDTSYAELSAAPSKYQCQGPSRKLPRPPKTSTPVLTGRQMGLIQDSLPRSVDSSTSQTEKNGDKETEESGYSDFDSTASTTTESHKEKSDFTSAWHSLADSAAEVELPNGKTMKSVTDSHKAPTKSGTDLHITSKRPIGDAPKEPSGSQVKQNLGRRKVSKMARDKDGLPIYPSRPDPVNLYHFYKAHWDKFKVPGEDPRSKLRWAVRTRLFYSK
ncbi:uncharacterized protein LOC121865481 [Homarus americanus]|uniref:uncharacterized protein LOC121865481 n=1 Tax=Homarus americanus TaxID=6706 RepID=UPI001C495388|nr:uncharacterized protein LOC121865481 [Homarus americanus]XP_042220903.1 uncharacterized protein LOC121865481 [Homarus americanus]